MSLAIVTKIRKKYPTPLGSKHAQCLVEISQAIRGSGLLKKTSGTRIKLPKPWNVEVAQDIICLRTSAGVDHYDIFKDGEGEASPTWNLVGPIDPDRFVNVTPDPIPVPDPNPNPTPGPAPTPPPTPPTFEQNVIAHLRDIRGYLKKIAQKG